MESSPGKIQISLYASCLLQKLMQTELHFLFQTLIRYLLVGMADFAVKFNVWNQLYTIK